MNRRSLMAAMCAGSLAPLSSAAPREKLAELRAELTELQAGERKWRENELSQYGQYSPTLRLSLLEADIALTALECSLDH